MGLIVNEYGEDYDPLAGLAQAIEVNEVEGRQWADISRVLAFWAGIDLPREGYDESDYVWLVEFRDGERGMYMGGHDSSGWECQSSLDLLPFEGWQDALRAHSETWMYEPPSAEVAIAALEAQIEALRSATPDV